jgi:hypothetical protein
LRLVHEFPKTLPSLFLGRETRIRAKDQTLHTGFLDCTQYPSTSRVTFGLEMQAFLPGKEKPDQGLSGLAEFLLVIAGCREQQGPTLVFVDEDVLVHIRQDSIAVHPPSREFEEASTSIQRSNTVEGDESTDRPQEGAP